MAILLHECSGQWNYFLALESDLQKITRYVEFVEDNFSTYSLEMAHLILAACSEIDVVCKEICKLENPNASAANIVQYKNIITMKFPSIGSMKSFIPRYGLEFCPWDNWLGNESPHWWKSYNNIKHDRNVNFSQSNLKNTLNSMSALFILNLILYRQKNIETLSPSPVLFVPMKGMGRNGMSIGGTFGLFLNV